MWRKVVRSQIALSMSRGTWRSLSLSPSLSLLCRPPSVNAIRGDIPLNRRDVFSPDKTSFKQTCVEKAASPLDKWFCEWWTTAKQTPIPSQPPSFFGMLSNRVGQSRVAPSGLAKKRKILFFSHIHSPNLSYETASKGVLGAALTVYTVFIEYFY